MLMRQHVVQGLWAILLDPWQVISFLCFHRSECNEHSKMRQRIECFVVVFSTFRATRWPRTFDRRVCGHSLRPGTHGHIKRQHKVRQPRCRPCPLSESSDHNVLTRILRAEPAFVTSTCFHRMLPHVCVFVCTTLSRRTSPLHDTRRTCNAASTNKSIANEPRTTARPSSSHTTYHMTRRCVCLCATTTTK